MTWFSTWYEVQAKLERARSEAEQDRNAHEARTQILHVDLGFKLTKFALRALQALGLVPRA